MVPTQPELYKSHNHLFCFSVSLFDSVTLVQTHLQNSKYRVWKKKLKYKFQQKPALENLHRGSCWLELSPPVLHQSTPVCVCHSISTSSQWSRLLPSFCPSCRAAMASLKCSFRLWISRSLRPFITLSSSCNSVYRSQARRFSCGAESSGKA